MEPKLVVKNQEPTFEKKVEPKGHLNITLVFFLKAFSRRKKKKKFL